MAVDIEKVHEIIRAGFELDEEFSEVQDPAVRRELITKYIKKAEDHHAVSVPDFEPGLEWFNTSRPVSWETDLDGKVVVLDFFTYCCINCVHVLPDLEALEEKFSIKDGVAVIGVHSAKFDNEKISANILSAILRYDIHHPVVNDHSAQLWQSLQVQCWPSFVIISPQRQLLYYLVGEGHRDRLKEFVSVAVQYYREKGVIRDHELPIQLARTSLPPSPLRFPGKVAVDKTGNQLAIADTGHHRVLVTDKQGIVKHVIGGKESGFKDGSLENARFKSPQGLVWMGSDTLFVADTENHAIRKVDLVRETVDTVAGTGSLGTDKEGGLKGTSQAISSPWDLTLGTSIGGVEDDLLYIAMAGSHQIWLLFLQDSKWLKGTEYVKGACLRFAGSGNEENRNNSYPHRAGLAQPSGLALGGATLPYLYIADSESSTVRTVSLKDGAVRALVGGTPDPLDLFGYGDKDGKGFEARLQHPLAVALLNTDDGPLLVADSYNHKLKVVTVQTKQCRTLAGSGQAGIRVGSDLGVVEFSEPGGLAVSPGGKVIYIADTNNHAIKTLDWETQEVKEFPILIAAHDQVDGNATEAVKAFGRITPASAPVIQQELLTVPAGGALTLKLQLDFPSNLTLTEGAPSGWQIWTDDLKDILNLPNQLKGPLKDQSHQPELVFQIQSGCKEGLQFAVTVECMLYYCDSNGTCHMDGLVFTQPVVISAAVNSQKSILQRLHYCLGSAEN